MEKINDTEMKLTIEQAIEQGYEYCAHHMEDYNTLIKLSKVTTEDFDKGELFLASKEPMHFTISAERISELIVENIDCQDEMADEDGELGELASEADFETLAKDINERMSKKKFYDLTDIILIP